MRDLTTTIQPSELQRIRALLAENPPQAFDENAAADYPRMLFNGTYLDSQREWKDNPDPLLKKKFAEKMVFSTHVVFDIDEEQDALLDGWKRSPADFLDPSKDPRIPVGREARKVALSQKLSQADEIRALTLRLAELTGRPVEQSAPVVEARAKRQYTRRKKRLTRRRPAHVAAAAVSDPPAPTE